MEPSKKSSSGSSCSLWNVRDLKQVPKKSDLSKLYKRIEKASRRFFHAEKNPTFVPSTQQNSGRSDTDIPPPPYPVDNLFGSGPGYSILPSQQTRSDVSTPPTYGWALNGIPTASEMPGTLGGLTLDVGQDNETAGSGFDYLNDHGDDYLRPREDDISEYLRVQNEQMKRLDERLRKENEYVLLLEGDVKKLNSYIEKEYAEFFDMNVDDLEEEVKILEEKLNEIRERIPNVLPPPRPRSPRQGNIPRDWKCPECNCPTYSDDFRCRDCHFPLRVIDPKESLKCMCQYCNP